LRGGGHLEAEKRKVTRKQKERTDKIKHAGRKTADKDMTGRKRMDDVLTIRSRIADIFLTVPDDDMYAEVLKIILEVMQSPYGVFGYINAAGALVVPSMTRHIWEKCQVPEKAITFPRDNWGDSSWPRAIKEKKANYTNEESVKTPEGHISIRRNISLPILFRDEVIGLMIVANKKTDYTEADFHSLETISGIIAPVLDARLKRARQEEALRASEVHFRRLFESAKDGFLILEAETGMIIDANPFLIELLGTTREQFIGRKIWDLGFFKHFTASPADFMELQQAGYVRYEDLPMVAADGRRIDVEFVSNVYEADNKKILQYNIRDITERKRAIETLAIQKRISEIFLTVRGEEMYYEVLKVILEVMESPFGIFGYIDEDGAEVVPSLTWDIWDKCRIPKKTLRFPRETWGDSSWPRAIRGKKANYSNETSTKTPEGHVSIRRHVSLPILFQGEVIGLFQVANKKTNYSENDIRRLDAIAEYVSPLLSARLQAQRHVEELKAKNDELVRFAYTISHDLKSPLVTIRTFIGYLEEDVRKPGRARMDKDIDYIRNAADKMARLLDELLELSRIGRKVNPSVEAPLQEVVKEALDLVAGRIAERGVKVEVAKEPIQLYGDRQRLVEIFQNLVDNAVKFMSDEPAPRVEIGAEHASEGTVLFVRDNGIGIEPSLQPKIFNLFEKLDPGMEGTGIGLALVRRIVEVHGGRIWVESEGRGKGATFRFTLSGKRGQLNKEDSL
jgi:PAS domain S-box-containing protein